MSELSGPQWCARFPSSNSPDDLLPDFRDRVLAFLSVLKGAGARVAIAEAVGRVEPTREGETRARSARICLSEAQKAALTQPIFSSDFVRIPVEILTDFLTRFPERACFMRESSGGAGN